MTELEAALVEIAAFLDESGLRYMLIGGLAVALWGEPRATLDVDVSVWVEPGRFEAAIRSVAAEFRTAPDALALAARTRVLPVLTAQGSRVDLVFAVLPEELAMIARAHRKAIGAVEIPIVSVEDLIWMKLISERSKDREDARRLLRRFRGTLDRAYLEPRLREISEALSRDDILETYRRVVS